MKERRTDQNLKKNRKLIYCTIIAIVILMAVGLIYIHFYRPDLNKFESSRIYNLTKKYREEGVIVYDEYQKSVLKEMEKPPTSPPNSSKNGGEDNPFKPGSAECAFVHALYAYDAGDYEKARELFLKSLEKFPESNDRGLLSCIYSYLNLCDVEEKGTGNVEYVKGALSSAVSFTPIANDHGLIWETAYYIADSAENDAVVTGLLQDILDKVPGLSLEASVRYNNIIAMLDNFDGYYGKSIRRFYDVRDMLMDVNAKGEVLRQKLFANSYIAGFYYEMEDYENAIKLYEENIAIPVEDPKLNAKAKYSDMINMGSACFEIGDVDKALEKCDEAEALLPHLDESIRLDVEAQICDSRARAAIIKGDFGRARSYIDKAAYLISHSESSAFQGSTAFIELTKCKLMVAKGDYDGAREVLEDLVISGDCADAGLEDEVYPILLDCIKRQKDVDAFFKYNAEFEEYKRDFHETVQKEYLEFSRYYSEVMVLQSKNLQLQSLISQSRSINLAFIIVIVVIIYSALKIRKAGLIDNLTGVYNRKVLTAILKKNSTPLKGKTVVIMMDIDHFKKYNDTYGHVMGDDVIRQMARSIKAGVRKKDTVIRYGGEEFLILLNGLDFETGLSVCERILENVRRENIPHKASETASIVTMSLGLCFNESDEVRLEDMINRADEALYEAKETGRNKICSIKL